MGLEERFEILGRYIPDVRKKLIRISRELKIPLNDLIDATVLSLSLSFELNSIPERIEYDEYGIPMQIHFPKAARIQSFDDPYHSQ